VSDFDERLKVIDEGLTLSMGVPPVGVLGTTTLDEVLTQLVALQDMVSDLNARVLTLEQQPM